MLALSLMELVSRPFRMLFNTPRLAYGWTYIPQDFVPYWGHCSATFCNFMTSKELGKGFAELKMPLGMVFGQRGPSLVEWGEIPSIYLYVYPYFGISPSWLAL